MEEANKFYEWMLKIKSIHLADNEQMSKAYINIYENEKILSVLLHRKKRCLHRP